MYENSEGFLMIQQIFLIGLFICVAEIKALFPVKTSDQENCIIN